MSGPGPQITDEPLAAGVLELASAAAEADGVAPLSEHAMLHVRSGGAENSVDLIISEGGTALGYAHLDIEDGLSGELVVHPDARRRGHGTALAAAAAARAGSGEIRLWAHGDLPAAAGFAASAGFTRFRALWQLGRPLAGLPPEPTLPAGIMLRGFVPGRDEEAWLEANRRAFSHHPEQGSWQRRDLELREREPWFDPAGFFLAERDGRLAGFHWTKIHPAANSNPPVGEVYVVGVDPAEQGSGLGRALTMAGLRYLAGRGLSDVMLYVDEENAPAVRMYQALGFTLWRTDVMYKTPPKRANAPTPSTSSSSEGDSGPSLAATAVRTSP